MPCGSNLTVVRLHTAVAFVESRQTVADTVTSEVVVVTTTVRVTALGLTSPWTLVPRRVVTAL